ncbi:hypothetical protein EV401DRAFT_2065689 [Pisolithus croceorrhizus]|nr:hypothetical protein EV401DRAFT_2065689 [Pisolithus croceorrhizus]
MSQTPSPLSPSFNDSDLGLALDRDLALDLPPEYASNRAIPPSQPQSPDSDDNIQLRIRIFRTIVPAALTSYNPAMAITQWLLYASPNTPAPHYMPAAPLTMIQNRPQPNTLCVAAMETLKLFKADEDEVQDPQMFLCTFNHIMRLAGIVDEGDKIEVLQDYIVPQSEVQKWYDNLMGSQ